MSSFLLLSNVPLTLGAYIARFDARHCPLFRHVISCSDVIIRILGKERMRSEVLILVVKCLQDSAVNLPTLDLIVGPASIAAAASLAGFIGRCSEHRHPQC